MLLNRQNYKSIDWEHAPHAIVFNTWDWELKKESVNLNPWIKKSWKLKNFSKS